MIDPFALKAFGSFSIVGQVVDDLAGKAYETIANKQIRDQVPEAAAMQTVQL